MQQAQQNYRLLAMTILIVLLALTVGTARSAGIASRGRRRSAAGRSRAPAIPGWTGPDYVGGADVTGHPVAPADLAAARQPVPDEILVPLGHRARAGRSGEGPMVGLDGKALEPILNPSPACPSKGR